jgi:hypothetical protein
MRLEGSRAKEPALQTRITVRSSARTTWRAAAVAAAAGAVTLAAVPAPASTAPAALATPGCATSALKVSIGAGSVTLGHDHYPLEFRNTSGARCTLFGYPGVSAISSTGAQLGSAAGRDAAVQLDGWASPDAPPLRRQRPGRPGWSFTVGPGRSRMRRRSHPPAAGSARPANPRVPLPAHRARTAIFPQPARPGRETRQTLSRH